MLRFPLPAVCAVLVLSASASADVPPPPGETRSTTSVGFRFKGVKDYPGYVFLFGYRSGRGNPDLEGLRVEEVRESQYVGASGYHLAGEQLIASPRKEFEGQKADILRRLSRKADHLAPNNDEAIPGILKVYARGTVNGTIDYRVHIDDGKMTLEQVVDQAAPSPAAPSAEPAQGRNDPTNEESGQARRRQLHHGRGPRSSPLPSRSLRYSLGFGSHAGVDRPPPGRHRA